ncbi:MAG: acyl-CoA synthetase [Halocynthiibacter sp.]
MPRYTFTSNADCREAENQKPFSERNIPATMYDALTEVTNSYGDRPAVSYQITSGPKDKVETLTWRELRAKSVQAANMFRDLGIGESDVVALLVPNANETLYALLGGSIAGIVNPINPLLDAEQIAGILDETGAKVLVTLKSFPKTDVAQKAAEAISMSKGTVTSVLEIDLLRYLTPPKSWIVPLIRPKNPVSHGARVLGFNAQMAKYPSDALTWEESKADRVAAYFHTGGTTGTPKVAQHKYSGMMYNGWCGAALLYDVEDVIICPLPLFHVFAVYPILMGAIQAGSHVVFPTPAGYRGDGVFDNFWKLIERYKVTFIITVPTAISALMQRPVDADVSSLKRAFSGSAPLPVELYHRFEKSTGVTIVEGYGLTEATCLVSCNPADGEKKIGSVGVALPHNNVRVLNCDEAGNVIKECETDEIGEICVSNPGVWVGHTYTEADKNIGAFADGSHYRTGDLGRIDEDGYIWITGRAKDLIIRGGHNIDPAEIEEALAGHEAVAFAGAIGQPDSFAGELPCVYVELVDGAEVTEGELVKFARKHVHERAAHPKYLEILDELPKTAVGKVFKPDLRKMAITRVYNAHLADNGFAAEVVDVIDDKKRGLVARLVKTGEVDEEALGHSLGEHTRPWEWAD